MAHDQTNEGPMKMEHVMKKSLFIAAYCMAVALPDASLGAHKPYINQGMSIGIDLGTRDFISRDIKDALDLGPGAGIFTQWGATDIIALKMGMLGSIHTGKGLWNNQPIATSITMMGMNVGLDFDLMPGAAFKPVIDIDIGGIGLNSDH